MMRFVLLCKEGAEDLTDMYDVTQLTCVLFCVHLLVTLWFGGREFGQTTYRTNNTNGKHKLVFFTVDH